MSAASQSISGARAKRLRARADALDALEQATAELQAARSKQMAAARHAYYDAGCSARAIGQATGMSPHTVARRLESDGEGEGRT